MNFGRLQLNDVLKNKLSLAVDNGALSHTVMITGGRQKDRKDLAILLSQALLCENSNKKPCLKCDCCKRIKAGDHPDVRLIENDYEKKSISIDTIRNVRDDAYLMPNEAPFQIFIIYETSSLGVDAQNSLLKILEEPPDTARFILVSGSKDDVVPTILSRATVYAISDDSGQAAGEKVSAKSTAAAEMILKGWASGSEYDIVTGTGKIEKDRKNIKTALEQMILILRDAAVLKYYIPDDCGGGDIANVLSRATSTDEIIKAENLLVELMADCDKNTNENLLITRLSIGLMDCIS